MSDEVLRQAVHGDRAALGELFRAFHPGLLRFLRGLAVAHAEDVAGQVWIEVARSLPRFKGDDRQFRQWLYAIARRRMIDAFRVSTRRLEDAVAEPPEPRSHADPQSADEAVDWAEAMLRLLPRSQAEIVLLRTIAGFSVAEVATITGRTHGAVRVLGHRGLARLRELLAEQELLPAGVTTGRGASME